MNPESALYERKDGLDVESTETAYYVLVDAAKWIVLEGAAHSLWSELQHAQTIPQLTTRLLEQYRGDADVVAADISATLREWCALGIVIESAGPRGAPSD